ncbi:MAG: GYD domain-containing protein [Acidobacteriota bacterium]
MPKYLIQVSYNADGVKGLQKDGGTKRQKAAQALVESVGGKMETFYFAFGGSDVVAILDMPDAASMAAASLALGASGKVTNTTTALVTPEEMDQAKKKAPKYKAPGQ